MEVELQMFAEKNLKRQTSNELRRGIKSLKKRILEHEAKIENPKNFYPDWDSIHDDEKRGNIRHWKHEIKIFGESVQNRISELKSRGENYE